VNNFDTASLLPLTVSGPLKEILDRKSVLSSCTPVAAFENLADTKQKVLSAIKNLGGVYMIVNLVTGHTYVGSAIKGNMGNRFHKHLYGGSGSIQVWSAVLKYGLEKLRLAFIVMETVQTTVTSSDNEYLLVMEDKYISLIKPEYNIAPQAGNTFGYRHTEEDKARPPPPPPFGEERKLTIQMNVSSSSAAGEQN
jgi:hypothetical protein